MPYLAGIRRFIGAGVTALVILVPAIPGHVSAEEAVAVPTLVTLVQFRSFMAPIAQQGTAKPCLRAVTVIVEVGESETDNVCTVMPRIRDAVLVELFRQPIVIDVDAGMDVGAVEGRLISPLNHALGKDAVRRVYLIPGSERVVEEIAARLPFNRIVGCRQRRSGRV